MLFDFLDLEENGWTVLKRGFKVGFFVGIGITAGLGGITFGIEALFPGNAVLRIFSDFIFDFIIVSNLYFVGPISYGLLGALVNYLYQHKKKAQDG